MERVHRRSLSGLLAALRQRCEIAPVVTEGGFERGRSVRPGFIGGVHVSVGAAEEKGFGGAANFERLSRA